MFPFSRTVCYKRAIALPKWIEKHPLESIKDWGVRNVMRTVLFDANWLNECIFLNKESVLVIGEYKTKEIGRMPIFEIESKDMTIMLCKSNRHWLVTVDFKIPTASTNIPLPEISAMDLFSQVENEFPGFKKKWIHPSFYKGTPCKRFSAVIGVDLVNFFRCINFNINKTI